MIQPLKFTANTELLNPFGRFNINKAMFEALHFRFMRNQAFIDGYFPA
jgi:hypothetical protein